MLFNSYIFIFCFLPLTLFVYFGLNNLKQYKAAKISLVAASLVFYGYNEMKYVFVILSSSIMNYLMCVLMRWFPQRKRWIVPTGVMANIVLLGYFKYFDFLLENINALTGSQFEYLRIALPLGISFFTFQQISYLIDFSRGACSTRGFLDYILFVTFFPQLVAGPIVSHDEMIPQFSSMTNKQWNFLNVSIGIQAFSIGLFKKVIIADNFGKIVSYGYGHVAGLSSLEAVLTILAFTIQIYFDFSGYCDMAAGIGLMFNIELPVNFDSPYKAKTIVEFWKRWHITLTRFLTKYVYIPLGGSKKGRNRTYINILLVFLVSGLWHGAGYTFILWGVFHGLANIVCRMWGKWIARIPENINWMSTFIFLNLTWVFFRAEHVDQALHLIARVFAGGFTISAELTETLLQPVLVSVPAQFVPFFWVIVGYIVIILGVAFFSKNTKEFIQRRSMTVWSLFGTYILFVISVLSLSGVTTFLYFNF